MKTVNVQLPVHVQINISHHLGYDLITNNPLDKSLHPTRISHLYPSAGGHVMLYVLVPLGVLMLMGVLAVAVVLCVRKLRVDKLRHRLMPLYSYDPQDVEDGDWEAELLEDEREQQRQLRSVTPQVGGEPQLTFFPPATLNQQV